MSAAEPCEDIKLAKQSLLGRYVLFTITSCGVAYITYRTIKKNIEKKVCSGFDELEECTSITSIASNTSITSETTTVVSFASIPSPPTTPLVTREQDRCPPVFKESYSMEVGPAPRTSMKHYLKQNSFQKQGLSTPRLLQMSSKPQTKILELPPTIQDSHSTDIFITEPKPIKVQLKHIRQRLRTLGTSHPRLFPSVASRSVDPYTPPKHHPRHFSDMRVLTPVTPDVTPPPFGNIAFTEHTNCAISKLSSTFLGESSYRETVVFLLALATHRLHPKEQLIICNTFKFGTKRRSYFCRFESNLELDDVAINEIETEMHKLSALQLEMQSKFIDYDTCYRMLTNTNQKLSAKLVQSLNRPCYRMVGVELDYDDDDDDFCFDIDDDEADAEEYSYYMLQYRSTLSNTKYCSRFKLHASDDNKSLFVVRFPHNEDNMDGNDKSPHNMEPCQRKQPQAIHDLYKQGVEMSKYLDIKSVADINGAIHRGEFKELVLLSEAYHNRQMVKISNMIKRRRRNKQLKMILISGPSSSGKTTFASKLGIYLHLALGMRPTVLEVDMWYRDRSDPLHPRDKQGNLNFETINALKLAEFNVALNRLLDGESVRVPKFDFKVGKRTGYCKEKLKLDDENGVIIMEGIFCLNPDLLQDVKQHHDISFKIFICPISPFYSLDNFHFISEQVMRLLRRISRDHFHRGCKADHVVFKWGQLTEGEDINIFPFVKHADAVFNSALLYEISVLKVYSYPLLQTVAATSKSYKDAQNLIAFLDMFSSMPDRSVPSDSLLMEFIGKSIFDEI